MSSNAPTPAADDPFDTLLTLEDTLYTSAYDLGASDGAHAGRIEGRIFGLEKGFEKFLALGALHGRSQVWGSRIPLPRPDPPSSSFSTTTATATATATPEQQEEEGERKEEEATALPLPALKPNARTARHIQTLHALSDPATFSTLNTEDAVADYDDRVKRAGAKAKMIERLVGEAGDPSSSFSASGSAAAAAAAGAGGASTPRVKLKNEPRREQNMEDFTGNRLLG